LFLLGNIDRSIAWNPELLGSSCPWYQYSDGDGVHHVLVQFDQKNKVPDHRMKIEEVTFLKPSAGITHPFGEIARWC
jgi:hypothetical protein